LKLFFSLPINFIYFITETIKVEILNSKVKKLINDLADLDLITIRESVTYTFSDVLKKLRSHTDAVPDPKEIAGEVETVRSERYSRSSRPGL
jgi:hypothetical protein